MGNMFILPRFVYDQRKNQHALNSTISLKLGLNEWVMVCLSNVMPLLTWIKQKNSMFLQQEKERNKWKIEKKEKSKEPRRHKDAWDWFIDGKLC